MTETTSQCFRCKRFIPLGGWWGVCEEYFLGIPREIFLNGKECQFFILSRGMKGTKINTMDEFKEFLNRLAVLALQPLLHPEIPVEISEDFILETQRLFSKKLGREISRDQALQFIHGFQGLFKILQEGDSKKER